MRYRWGFQWGKVATGASMFFVGGGISLALWLGAHMVNHWAAGIAIVGFFTMLSGLVGEEGIW